MRHNNLIPAGKSYIEPGYIEAMSGLYDAPLRFEFSPLLPEERADHLDKTDRLTGGVKKQQAFAAVIAERVKKWDLVDGHGDPVSVQPVNVLRLKPSLFSRLYGIILGVDPSDIDPQWPQEEKATATEAEYASALSQRPVSEVLLEGAEKNSEAD